MKSEIIILTLTIFLFGCGCDSNSTVLENVDLSLEEGIILEYGEEEHVTRIIERSPGHLKIACPLGVICDENWDYRAHSYDDDNVNIYMSFGPELVNNYSLESLVESFNYFNLVIMFPDRSTEKTIVNFSSLDPLRELGSEVILMSTTGMQLDFFNFEDGRLRGEIKGIMTELTHITEDANDPNCFTGDIRGICSTNEAVNIPFVLSFNLLVNQ